jgi:hypothetical protein
MSIAVHELRIHNLVVVQATSPHIHCREQRSLVTVSTTRKRVKRPQSNRYFGPDLGHRPVSVLSSLQNSGPDTLTIVLSEYLLLCGSNGLMDCRPPLLLYPSIAS